MQAEQLFDRTDHEPEVAEYREHLADRQVREQHGKHRRGAEHIDAELEQQAAGAPGGVALPLRGHGVVADLLGAVAEAAEESPGDCRRGLPGSPRLPARTSWIASRVSVSAWVKRAVLSFSSFLRCLTRLPSCTVDQITSGLNSRISKASCQCIQTRIAAVPSSVSKATRKRLRVSDELVQGIQVGHQVGADRPAAEGFVFAQGDMPEALDQTQADAVDDVLDSRANSFAWSTLNTSAAPATEGSPPASGRCSRTPPASRRATGGP